MRILRTFAYLAAADMLSLFVAFTLAVSGSLAARLVSAVCTVGILFCLMAALAAKTAREDMKRQGGKTASSRALLIQAAEASLPCIISWAVLLVSRTSFPVYYRWHKLLNSYFLQIYNLISPSLTSAQLTAGQLAVMGLLTLVPGASFLLAAVAVRRKLSSGC